MNLMLVRKYHSTHGSKTLGVVISCSRKWIHLLIENLDQSHAYNLNKLVKCTISLYVHIASSLYQNLTELTLNTLPRSIWSHATVMLFLTSLWKQKSIPWLKLPSTAFDAKNRPIWEIELPLTFVLLLTSWSITINVID